jgi:hypothetical protein
MSGFERMGREVLSWLGLLAGATVPMHAEEAAARRVHPANPVSGRPHLTVVPGVDDHGPAGRRARTFTTPTAPTAPSTRRRSTRGQGPPRVA